MPTIDKMNQEIAMWLHGSGKDTKIVHEKQKHDSGKVKAYWKLVRKIKFGNTTVDKFLTDKHECNFNEDYNKLMKVFNKILETDGTWYAIYKRRKSRSEGLGKNRKIVYDYTYYCAFTTDGHGRFGYGAKLNDDFCKESIILAMHYSLYRFIKNGNEY